MCLGLKRVVVTVAVTGSPTNTSFGCTEQVAAGPLEYSALFVGESQSESHCANAPRETTDTARLRPTTQNRLGCFWAIAGAQCSITDPSSTIVGCTRTNFLSADGTLIERYSSIFPCSPIDHCRNQTERVVPGPGSISAGPPRLPVITRVNRSHDNRKLPFRQHVCVGESRALVCLDGANSFVAR